VAIFEVHASADGMDFSRSETFGYPGDLFVAEFGDQAPVVGKVLTPVGFKVVRVSIETGLIEDFLVNRGKVNGPASATGGGGLERPVCARFDPTGRSLYVVDFGVVAQSAEETYAQPGTGALWRVQRETRSIP
jgi:glucose/arabinose dehydrogenase